MKKKQAIREYVDDSVNVINGGTMQMDEPPYVTTRGAGVSCVWPHS